jgi:hypothetical protein
MRRMSLFVFLISYTSSS